MKYILKGDKIMSDYQVLLYYKYTTIDDPETFAKEHLAACKEMELKGRILVATEGINGTVSGTVEATNKYMDYMANDARFADMVFKIDAADAHAFKKMHVRPRAEIVSLSLEEDVNPLEVTGTYLEPSEFREALLDEDTVILDARNDYEFDIGHFAALFVQIFKISVSYQDGLKIIASNLLIKKSSLTVLVVFVVRNFPVG